MLKFTTLLALATSLGCASPESLGSTRSQAALVAERGVPEPIKADEPTPDEPTHVGCLNDTPEGKAQAKAEAEAAKKRPKVREVSGYRAPAALKSKIVTADDAPRFALPEVKMTEKERLGRIMYAEEFAKLEKKHAGDPKKLRDEAWAIKRKLLTP